MKAIDTNVIVRYVVRDDEAQADIATRILQLATYIPTTVLLETAWLLASRYRMQRGAVAATLRDLLRLPDTASDDPSLINWAIDRYEAGADIADMLHMVSARSARTFATFDKALSRHAGNDGPVTVETLA